MKSRHLVVWAFGVGIAGAATGLGACAPSVTVSRDDEPGGAGGTDVTTTVGGASSVGGHAGTASARGGSSGSGDSSSSAGSAVMVAAGRGGTGGDDGLGSAGMGPEVPDNCPCTRRPDAPVSRDCPRGRELSTEAVIGPEGGEGELSHTASTAGVPFRVKVFAGSVENGTWTITLGETSLAPPQDLFDVSPVYSVGPDGVEFTGGGEVSIPWIVPSGNVPEGIAVYYAESPEGPWERIDDSYTNAGFEQATLSRAAYFVAAYPKTGAFTACP